MAFRAFIAVEIDANRSLEELLNELKATGADLKLVAPANVHLTLKFLGNIQEAVVPDIVDVMQNSVADVEPFAIQLNGVGAFPSAKHIRVIWIGAEDAEPLLPIAARLEEGLASLGFKKERRMFAPHATIARARSARNKDRLQEFLRRNRARQLFKLDVNCIRLKKSVLSPQGPTYSTASEVRLERSAATEMDG